MRRTARCLLAGLSLLAAGLGCKQRELPRCDITERACQESIYYRVLNLRGDGYDPFGGLPPVSVISEAEFRALLEREYAAAAAENGPRPGDKALALLHFTPGARPAAPDGGAGVDGGAGAEAGGTNIDDEVTHTYAFYDSEMKNVTIISHPDQTGPYAMEEAMVWLAHELVHALQDREMDLQQQDLKTSDEYLANDGLIEGDARFYEFLFREDVRRLLDLKPSDPTQMPDVELAGAYQDFSVLGSPWFAAQYLMYPLGAKYEATAYRSGGNAAVRHAYANAPIRTVGFLVGADGRAPPVGTGDVCPAPQTAGLPTTVADQFGAVLLYSFLRGFGVGHDVAFATAQSWTGDYLRVQSNKDLTTVAVAWRLEFATAPSPDIAPALTASRELSVTTGSRSLEITVSDSPTPLAWKPTANCP
jgi:hypothetical protein